MIDIIIPGRKLTVVFDIDGVLCVQGSDYENAVPYPHGVARVNEAYARGHHVVLQTARYMKRANGNARLAAEMGFALTHDWLQRHGVRFHELHFGKRSADLYVDDRGCRVESAADWESNYAPLLRRLEGA